LEGQVTVVVFMKGFLQGIPLQGVANTTISVETKNMTVDLEALLDKLRMIDGVKRLEVLGQG